MGFSRRAGPLSLGDRWTGGLGTFERLALPRPEPALVLVPTQQLLGLLMISLDPVPPVRVLHHPLQGDVRAEVAPVVPPLTVRGVLADQRPAWSWEGSAFGSFSARRWRR